MFQAGHTDDEDAAACEDPDFCSCLIPISGDCNVRVWKCSQDVVKLLNKASGQSQSQRDREESSGESFGPLSRTQQEEQLANKARALADPGSLIAQNIKIDATNVSIPRGSSMLFLSSLFHAGTGMGRFERKILWCMHLYALRPGKNINQKNVHVPTAGLASMCAKSGGGDHDV